MSSGFHIKRDTLTLSLETMNPRVEAAIELVLEYYEAYAETYMRTHASWTDRTTNARNGLFAKAENSGSTYRLVMFHTMDYGLWLEVRWNGKYAIIGPTQRHVLAEIFPTLDAAIDRAMRGAA